MDRMRKPPPQHWRRLPVRADPTRMLRAVLVCLALTSPVFAENAEPKLPDRKTQLDVLLTALRAAPDEDAAVQIEQRVQLLWLQSPSAAADLLMAGGTRALANDAGNEAEQDFDAAVALEPGFTEAWHRRAIARAAQGDSQGAIADIGQALAQEPRYFPALDTLTRIAIDRKDFKGAFAAWSKKLEIDPECAGGREKLNDLRRRAFGDDT